MKKLLRQRLLLGTALPLLLAGANGCREVLEEDAAPVGTLSETSLSSVAGIEGSLIATYRALDWNGAVGGGWGNAASNWAFGSVPSDDAYKGSEATDQPAIDDIERYQWGLSGANDYFNDKWRGAYEGVVRANATVRALAALQAAQPTAVSASDGNSILGEAIFLRAHYHFEAYRMWGNVPYYRGGDTDIRKPNAPAAEVAQNILVDLDSAIAILPTSPRNGQVGRVTQWAAKAYKGRVLAYTAQWPAALTQLREVQASGVYDLEESFDRVWTGFADYANKKETILAYQASSSTLR